MPSLSGNSKSGTPLKAWIFTFLIFIDISTPSYYHFKDFLFKLFSLLPRVFYSITTLFHLELKSVPEKLIKERNKQPSPVVIAVNEFFEHKILFTFFSTLN